MKARKTTARGTAQAPQSDIARARFRAFEAIEEAGRDAHGRVKVLALLASGERDSMSQTDDDCWHGIETLLYEVHDRISSMLEHAKALDALVRAQGGEGKEGAR